MRMHNHGRTDRDPLPSPLTHEGLCYGLHAQVAVQCAARRCVATATPGAGICATWPLPDTCFF